MQLGWIDFSKGERDKVFSVMHLLEEQGAVDELGIGIIRDAFADYFFPGTSTVQTRAKYFLIVPYILKEAVSGEYGSEINAVLRRINNEERNCRDILLRTSNDGVIGRLVPHSWVQRTPASIYWNGLKQLGILTEDISMSNLIRESILQKSLKKAKEYGNREKDSINAQENEEDDADAGDITSFHFLNLGGTYKRDWRNGLRIELLPEEAVFLKSQIIRYQRDKLIAFIVKNNISLDRYESFKAFSEDVLESVDSDTAELIILANDFNDLVSIITTRYNLIVSEGKNATAVKNWVNMSRNLSSKATVDLKRIYKRLDITNYKLKAFLIGAQDLIRAGDIEQLDQLIINREVDIKDPSRAKTKHAGKYPYNTWIGLDVLDYRFTPTKRIVRDIMDAESQNHV